MCVLIQMETKFIQTQEETPIKQNTLFQESSNQNCHLKGNFMLYTSELSFPKHACIVIFNGSIERPGDVIFLLETLVQNKNS